MTSANGKPEQIGLLPDGGEISVTVDATGTDAGWLGLLVDDRRLLDALQDDWLRPKTPGVGQMVGVGSYASEHDGDQSRHAIPVRVRLDVTKLPVLEVPVFRDGGWACAFPDAIRSTDIAVHWPGALPAFAISCLMTDTAEQCARLTGMARMFSNVELPDVPVMVRDDDAADDVVGDDLPPASPVGNASALTIPSEADSLRGAMSMAVWAVPRIDPWLDVLVASLSSDHDRLPKLTSALEAGWWRFPPWARPVDCSEQPQYSQDCLWLAAVDVFRRGSADADAPPLALAEQIAGAATTRGCPSDETSAWFRTTHGILRAESMIRLHDWRACPVGIAIQLVLARLEPTRFKSWSRDMPDLPPAVWWSAAVLCGLHHGYRKLDIGFRGTPDQRAYIAAHALRACTDDDIRWPFPDGKLCWSRKPDGPDGPDGFVLRWGHTTISDKSYKAHGRWYTASFDDKKVVELAKRGAKDLRWPCWKRYLKLGKDGRMPYSGRLTVENREIRALEAVTMQLPTDYVIEEALDVESFRRLVAVEGARLPEPPVADICSFRIGGLRIERQEISEVPGLSYVRDFLTDSEEREIMEAIERADWIDDLQRRVQHYGWRYDYRARRVDPGMYLGELPLWAGRLAHRLQESGLVPHLPDQVIVNEYGKGQGIGKHVDSESFGDGIAMISLLDSWEMKFRDRASGRKVHPVMLERRSAAIIQGAARYRWTHEIPARKKEPLRAGERPARDRGRRVSLTFRKVLAEH